jgi:predicted deacylase
MSKRKAFTIAGQKVAPGETRTLSLKFSESYLGSPVTVPIHVLRARKPGPRLLLTGCVHGDELNGMGIIRELLYDQPPKLVKGTLVCVPVVNVYGLEHHLRYLPDRRDLNRDFPGSENGSLSSRLAHVIFENVVRQCDYLVDFHSAAVRRTNYPNIRADLSHPETRALARSFGCELIVNGKGPVGSLRRAALAAGVPSIILEAGEVWKSNRAWSVSGYVG